MMRLGKIHSQRVIAGDSAHDASIELSDDELEAAVRAEAGEDYDDYALITDYLAGELSAEQRERVEERLGADPKFRALADPLIVFWNRSGPRDRMEDDVDAVGSARGWQRLKRRIELEEAGVHTPTLDEKRTTRRKWRSGLSAVILSLLAGWLAAHVRPQLFPVPAFDLHMDTPRNVDERSATLRDGTQVTLAADSHLTFHRWFGDSDEHTLNLVGEGTFTVAPGSRSPLVIEAPNVQVTALEGRFTVEAYSPMPIAYVRVHEGRVEVRAHSVVYGFGQVLTLHAGEGARVGPDLWIRLIMAPIAAHGTRPK